MGRGKKRYIVEEKVNSCDEFKPLKKFNDLEKAKQSLKALRKSKKLFNDINNYYFNYRLFDSKENIYIDD